MAWYKITCRCTVCGMKWARRTTNPDSPDPACPNLACGEIPVPIGMDLTSNRAPATIGGNLRVKAIDETANIVMQDYGMTNMRDDVREGESATPPLPTEQRAAADAYFGTGRGGRANMPILGMPGVRLGDIKSNLGMSSRAAIAGAFRDNSSTERSIGDTHRQRLRPPVHVVNRQE